MEITLHDMRRLVDIGDKFQEKHKTFGDYVKIETDFRPRGEKVYCHVQCFTDKEIEYFRYQINISHNVEGEGWPINQIGYQKTSLVKEPEKK